MSMIAHGANYQYCINSEIEFWVCRPATCCINHDEVWHGGVNHSEVAT